MNKHASIAAVDLFCGAGRLTHGLLNAGINVRLGVDLDPACQFPIEENNDTKFVLCDVSELAAQDITKALSGTDVTLMAGCAPCQPFSNYSRPQINKVPHKD